MRGWAKAFGGEWVVRSAGLNAHSPLPLARTRIIIIIRPPRHSREIKAMGQKRRSRECSSLAKTSAPAPSAFIFPRPRSHFPHEAFGGAHEDFGPPQQQLSTMGYPRKSYPHRCSPPCAKRSRPRACARVYNNISFARRPLPGSVRAAPEKSPRRCGTVARTAVRRVGEGKAKADAPSRSAEQCRLRAE